MIFCEDAPNPGKGSLPKQSATLSFSPHPPPYNPPQEQEQTQDLRAKPDASKHEEADTLTVTEFSQDDVDFWAFAFGEWMKTNHDIFWRQPRAVFESQPRYMRDVVNQDPRMTKEEANRLLSACIKILKGSCTQPDKGKISDCLWAMRHLNNQGYWWQAERLQNWIYKFQKEHPT